MATRKGNEKGTTRREFFGAMGAVAAAAALPAVAAPPPAPSDWRAILAQIPALQAAYLAEIARFAATLRPRFEAGELHAFRDSDETGPYRDSPVWELERLCAAHFGLGRPGAWDEGDSGTARLILIASPHTDATGEGSSVHPCDHAREAVAWDVIAMARARDWYTPTEDEDDDPINDTAGE